MRGSNPLPERAGDSRADAAQPAQPAQPAPPAELEAPITLEELQTAQAYIELLKAATLDESPLDIETLARLRNPLNDVLDLDPDLRLSIDLFLASINGSQQTYTDARAGVLRRHPEDEILSHAQMKSRLVELTGVTSIRDDMCVNSCMAFTGPNKDLTHCSEPNCNQPRYLPNGAARQQFHTIPLGPQLQALWRTEEGARNMRHRSERTAEILAEMEANGNSIPVLDDVYCGSDYIAAVRRGDITTDDMVLIFSIDGAQLYESKQSDCWIYIWIICDLSPELRYKKKYVLPGGFIPGPFKPKHPDSYLYTGLHHVSALQKEGLMVWDALEKRFFRSFIYLLLDTADGPGMQYLNGLVGHSGAYGCRLYCPVKSRHKPGVGIYYPAHLKPDNYTVHGCDHPDVDVKHIPRPSTAEYEHNLRHVLQSQTIAQYKQRRLATGISKQSIFSGLPSNRTLPVPHSFPADLMHLVSLNLTDLLMLLWRGTLDCDTADNRDTWDWAVFFGDVWKSHGKVVAQTKSYLPGSFDRPPRNPAEKMNSGYKAWEWLMYMFALGPGLFYGILPNVYWKHHCKLVAGIRLLQQRSISAPQIVESHRLLISFVEDFEQLYYQRKGERIHFCRQSLHALCHIAPETIRLGPYAYFTQWTMERTIGNLGEEIKQPSNPYANLSQRGVLRSQINALKSMFPDLEPDATHRPRGSIDLGDGYVLLRARQRNAKTIDGAEGDAVREYLEEQGLCDFDDDEYPNIIKWARLMLPTKQIARTFWRESLKALEDTRMSRNVKVGSSASSQFLL